MEHLLLWVGRLAALAGVLILVVAGLARVSGMYTLGGFQLGTLLLVGIASAVVACLCFLMVLTNRTLLNERR